jgi:hypothetical protein
MLHLAVLNFGELLRAFAKDSQVHIVVTLVAVDVLLGICAAIKMGKFSLSYVADFLRNDIVLKMFPWFVLYSAGKLTSTNPIPGIDFTTLAKAAFGLICAALIGSIGSSVLQLGLDPNQARNLAEGGSVGGRALTTLLGPENPATPETPLAASRADPPATGA